MKKYLLVAAYFFAIYRIAEAAAPPANTALLTAANGGHGLVVAPAENPSLRLAATMSNAEAAKQPHMSFDATVTYDWQADRNLGDLFVQDGDDAIYVAPPANLKVQPGDRIHVEGSMRASFRPYVQSDSITVIGHGKLPTPVPASFTQMIRGQLDCRFVTIRANIHSADLQPGEHSSSSRSYLRMAVDGGQVDANLDNSDAEALKGLLDSDAIITGVASGHFDNKMQQTGVLMHISSISNIRIVKRSAVDPWSLPVTPMGSIIVGYHSIDQSQRTRVEGTITYYQPGGSLVLQDGTKSLLVNTGTYEDLKVGDWATAIGFPNVQNGFLSLDQSEVRKGQVRATIPAALLSWNDLSRGGNVGHGHSFDLVSIEGKVITEVRQEAEDEYVLDAGGHLFSAIMRRPSSSLNLQRLPMANIPPGSIVRVTGICVLADANPFNGEVPFSILLRNVDDIDIIARPTWLNVHHLEQLAGILVLALIAVGLWALVIERTNRRQIGSLAYVEKRRGRILEDINNSEPLAEILERVTELVSVRLRGTPCWCSIEDGATLGNRPKQLDPRTLRVAEKCIAARNGPALGKIYVAFDARTKPSPAENEALAMATELAKLAIETSRLYSDLVRRSEFDLLTDVQNRFAMERTLDAMIHDARQRAGIFGLIYIDLNDFKLVNDVHGHLTGDLYLQEVARRMKTQLRPGDALARLGGDEFVALIGSVRSRSEVEEVATRLQACFLDPFVGDGYALHGSASFGIALYPEDASSADSMLSAADAAMYTAKYSRPGRKSRVKEEERELETENLR